MNRQVLKPTLLIGDLSMETQSKNTTEELQQVSLEEKEENNSKSKSTKESFAN